jgi:hypothetical protein
LQRALERLHLFKRRRVLDGSLHNTHTEREDENEKREVSSMFKTSGRRGERRTLICSACWAFCACSSASVGSPGTKTLDSAFSFGCTERRVVSKGSAQITMREEWTWSPVLPSSPHQTPDEPQPSPVSGEREA